MRVSEVRLLLRSRPRVLEVGSYVLVRYPTFLTMLVDGEMGSARPGLRRSRHVDGAYWQMEVEQEHGVYKDHHLIGYWVAGWRPGRSDYCAVFREGLGDGKDPCQLVVG